MNSRASVTTHITFLVVIQLGYWYHELSVTQLTDLAGLLFGFVSLASQRLPYFYFHIFQSRVFRCRIFYSRAFSVLSTLNIAFI